MKKRSVVVIEAATRDLEQGRDFYQNQSEGLGDYFLSCSLEERASRNPGAKGDPPYILAEQPFVPAKTPSPTTRSRAGRSAFEDEVTVAVAGSFNHNAHKAQANPMVNICP